MKDGAGATPAAPKSRAKRRGTRPRRGWSECSTCTQARGEDVNFELIIRTLGFSHGSHSHSGRNTKVFPFVASICSRWCVERSVKVRYEGTCPDIILAGMRITYPRVDGRFCGGI